MRKRILILSAAVLSVILLLLGCTEAGSGGDVGILSSEEAESRNDETVSFENGYEIPSSETGNVVSDLPIESSAIDRKPSSIPSAEHQTVTSAAVEMLVPSYDSGVPPKSNASRPTSSRSLVYPNSSRMVGVFGKTDLKVGNKEHIHLHHEFANTLTVDYEISDESIIQFALDSNGFEAHNKDGFTIIALQPGTATVSYTVEASDGRNASGVITFTVTEEENFVSSATPSVMG